MLKGYSLRGRVLAIIADNALNNKMMHTELRAQWQEISRIFRDRVKEKDFLTTNIVLDSPY